MIQPNYWSRRVFLRTLLASSGSALFAPAAMALDSIASHNAPDLALKLANLFDNKESASVVGATYLRSRSVKSSIPALLEELFPMNHTTYENLGALSPSKLKLYLFRRRREDFRINHVVDVDGWVLSLTEARLCALVTLVL